MILSCKHTALIIGSEQGFLRVLYWPIVSNNPDYYDIHLDYSSITDLAFTPCGKYLFVSSNNSILFSLSTGYVRNCNHRDWSAKETGWDKSVKNRERYSFLGYSMFDSVDLIKLKRIKVE